MAYKKLNKMFSLKNKKVLIIGGAGYLGGAMSETFAELGAEIIISSRNIQKGEKYVKSLKKEFKNKIYFYPVDITNSESIKSLLKFTNKKFRKKLDVLVNCGWTGNKNTFESITDKDWNFDVDICLSSVF